jgi:glycosyltransferase involved in cell wall biosynthesis
MSAECDNWSDTVAAEMSSGLPHVGFVLERSLGHVTHAETLTRLLPREPSITTDIAQLDFAVDGRTRRVPVFNSNWTVRAGIRARQAIRRMNKAQRLDALFVNTQVPAVLVPDWIRRVPSVVSLDATPMQYDELGEQYEHETGNRHVERLKWRLNRECLVRARHIVTWSQWAKDGVVDGYDIPSEKVTVIPPGVDASLWRPPPERPRSEQTVRILFVGGDLARKGGDTLIESFRVVRDEVAEDGGPDVRLDLVTRADVDDSPGIDVHRTMTPNSAALIELFHRADIFALPTRADCLPLALLEAGAAELPLVGTSVAGVPEIVREGETGVVVPPGDRDGLVGALRTLVEDQTLRRRLGAGAGRLVAERFDAASNTHHLVDLLTSVVSTR